MDPSTCEIIPMVWHKERRNVENTFFLCLAYSGWKGFSSLNADFFIKAENMVPVPSYEMLLFIKEWSWRETQRKRNCKYVLTQLQLCQAKSCLGPHVSQPTSSCSSLPFWWRHPLLQTCWEHRPPACSPICFDHSETSLSDRLWFIWQKNGFKKLPRSYPVGRFVEAGIQCEWWRTAGWPSQQTQPRRNWVNSLSTQERQGTSRCAFEKLNPQGKLGLHRIQSSNRSMYSAVTNWQQEMPNAQTALDRKGFRGLSKQTELQLLLDHTNNTVVSATHSTSWTWAEPADGCSQLQSQTQSLAHTLCIWRNYNKLLKKVVAFPCLFILIPVLLQSPSHSPS